MQPTARFSNRVDDYVKYRPGYPVAICDDLVSTGILRETSILADIGSGTGLLTELFLKRGNLVFGVEPNAEMRAAGENYLQQYPHFKSIIGTAEQTTLPPTSVDLISAGQAFHWFDREKTRMEFERILRPGGAVVLVWNERLTSTSPFLKAYEELLQKFSTDYATVDHRRITDEIITAFFTPGQWVLKTYPNHQSFDFNALRGRLLSSSYAPPVGHPQHEPMLAGLHRVFEQFAKEDRVTFEYTTQVYCGRFS